MLAIIIPFYKLAYFEETIQSLANQSDQRFKVYIGDDASPECPKKIIEKYQDKFDVNYYRFNENLGSKSLTKQWQRCIDLSKSEKWIMILGDDDVLGSDVVAEFYKKIPVIDKEEIKVVRYSSQLINDKNENISTAYTHPRIEKSTTFLIKKVRSQTRSSLSEYIFNKEKVLQVGFKDYPLGWYSDDMAVLEFSDFNTIYTINEAIVFVRFSLLSISGDLAVSREKNKAKFLFYYSLLSGNFFSKDQVQILFPKLFQTYLSERKQVLYFLRITGLCIKSGEILGYIGFLKSILHTFSKRTKESFNVK